jgi:CheY-like chemotaxis protein
VEPEDQTPACSSNESQISVRVGNGGTAWRNRSTFASDEPFFDDGDAQTVIRQSRCCFLVGRLATRYNDIEATHLTESPVERRSVERARRSRDRPSIEGPLTDRPPKSGDPWRLDGLRLAAMRRRCVDCDADDMAVRCLIVDDSVQFLEVARSGLHRDGIDVVGTATTSLEALYEVQRLRPDVVLVDISLGDESGFDLSCRLAELPEFRARIVLISTRAQEDLAELIAASPAVGFIPKSRLSAKAVRKLVDESPNAPQGK